MEDHKSRTKEDAPNEDKDDPNKHSDIFQNNKQISIASEKQTLVDSDESDDTSVASEKQTLVDSDESDEDQPHFMQKNMKEYKESPRTNLSIFIPDTPFKINVNNCESKIFIKPGSLSNGYEGTLSSTDDAENNDISFSKSYDCSVEIIQSLKDHMPITRSVSEDFLQNPSAALQRKISMVTTVKGKLIGVPRVRPGEKLVRSPSTTSQTPFVSSGKNSSEDVSSSKKFTTEQKWIILCLCLVDFTAFLCMSVIAPFFPHEAELKGMREAVSGFVFSIYALVMMLASPIFGKIMPVVGAKFMFLSGVGFCGSCNILFGLLDKVNGQVEFTALCFIVRSFEAVGAAAFSTASCTILIDQFPDDIGTIFGFMETCMGIGMSIGPAIGGALYAIGGFSLPFFTLGGFVVSIVPLCYYLLHNVEDPEVVVGTTVSYKKLLSMPHVIVVCLILVFASQAQGFIDPTLEPHMRQYDLNASLIGLLFLLLSGTYAMSSPIFGWISGRMENKYPLMIFGLIILTVSILLLGPSSFLPFEGSLWLSVFSLALMGVSLSAVFIPTFESLFIAAMNGGLEDDINTYSVVSGLWNSIFSLGEVTGPSIGGILADFFTFPQASTLIAVCTLAAFFVALIAWINPCECFGPHSLIEDSEEKQILAQQSKASSIPPREQTPLQDGSVHTYGSLWEDKKNPVV